MKKEENKVSKEDIVNCAYVKNFREEDKIIKFDLDARDWNDGVLFIKTISIEAPNIDLISYKSFSPSSYMCLDIGAWINSLIKVGKTIEDKEDNEPQEDYKASLKSAAKQWIETMPKGESPLSFVTEAIAAIKTETTTI